MVPPAFTGSVTGLYAAVTGVPGSLTMLVPSLRERLHRSLTDATEGISPLSLLPRTSRQLSEQAERLLISVQSL